MMHPNDIEAIIRLLRFFVAIMIIMLSMRIGRAFYLMLFDV